MKTRNGNWTVSLTRSIISQSRTYYRYKKEAKLIVFVVRTYSPSSLPSFHVSETKRTIICTDTRCNVHEIRRKRYKKIRDRSGFVKLFNGVQL